MNHVIKLEVSSNRKKIQLASDFLPAALILLTGLKAIREGAPNALAYINIASGCLILIFGLREWKSLKQQAHQKVHWYDFISGIVLLLNAVAMYKPGKGFQPAYLYCAASILIILKSISVVKPVSFFHRITISDTGFTLRMSPFSIFRFAWKDVLDIEIKNHILYVTTPEGKREILMKRISDNEEMNTALLASLRENRPVKHFDETTLRRNLPQ